jgi:TonB family protein
MLCFTLFIRSIPVKIRVLAWLPLAATLLLSGTISSVYALPNEILIAQTSAQDYLQQGNARINRKDYQGAVEDFTKAISLKPDYAEAYVNRASARNGLKDYQGAKSDGEKAADLFRKSEDTVSSQKAEPAPPEDAQQPLSANTAGDSGLLERRRTRKSNSSSLGGLSSRSPGSESGEVANSDGFKPNCDGPGERIDAAQDTDFGPYMAELKRRVKRNWIPPEQGNSRRSVLRFSISRAGEVSNLRVGKTSGNPDSDAAAMDAVSKTAPFESLPSEYKGKNIDIQFTFDINVFGGDVVDLGKDANDQIKVEHYLDKGNARYIGKDCKGAIEAYNQAISLKPDFADAYNKRSEARYGLKDYKGAIEDSNKAISLNPNEANVYLNRGSARYHLRDYKGTIADYTKAISLNPDEADAYVGRGNARNELEDYQGGIEDSNKAISLNPDDASAYINRSFARNGMRNSQGAIEDANKAISLKPNSADDEAETYRNRGAARASLKDYKGAIEDATKAISLKPNYADAYRNRGAARASLKNYKGAIEDANKAISLNPNDADAYNNRSFARNGMKDYQGAESDRQKAAELFRKKSMKSQ